MHDGDKIGKAATGKLIRTKNRRESSEIRSLQEVSGSHEYRKKKVATHFNLCDTRIKNNLHKIL